MPSRRPQAAFEPIPPDLDLQKLVEETEGFGWAVRIHCDMIEQNGLDQFERLILIHVILGGKPLVIEGYESRLDKWTFTVQWLRDNWGTKVVDARDLTADKNVPLTVQHYLKHMPLLTNQWDARNYKDKERQRMYLKDIDCPPMWAEKLRAQLPLGLFYLNDNTGELGGIGAVDGHSPQNLGAGHQRGIAKAGDLMSSLPNEMRAENLMCYIGHEGTYTPAHREMCGCLGQNVMVEASSGCIEDGQMTKPGSSIWFMTETKEREVVSEYWLSRLGHDIEIEKHFAQINAWKQAPFKVWVVEQKPGDFILIPPLAPHQVWNRGTRTMKVAWNRTTVETLEMAINEALPKARMVCRDEQYKNKAIIYFTLQKYSQLLKDVKQHKDVGMLGKNSDAKVKQLEKDFKRLHNLFTSVLVSETFSPEKREKGVERVVFDGNITCSYCRCNIFNRFLTCPACVGQLPDGNEDTYDVCLDCYAMGRSCLCISKLRWVEQFDWTELVEHHERWRRQIIELEGKVDTKSPRTLRAEMLLRGQKLTLAQICQSELTRRPWHDVKNEANERDQKDDNIEQDGSEEDNAAGNAKKRKKIRRSDKYIREHGRCHVDCYWEPRWKQAQCSNCDKNYCYGNLFRAYDEMPQDIIGNPEWQCPSCRKICGCRHCRHKPGFKQYTPKGTLLGHNTKAVADVRSVESLVDFSYSNIAWIQKAGDDHEEDTRRLRRRLQEAEVMKASETEPGDDYVNGAETHNDVEAGILRLANQEGIPIDPALGAAFPDRFDTMEHFDHDRIVEHPEELQHTLPVAGEDTDQDTHHNHGMVPDGGILFDREHAYEHTDAITFEYPDVQLAQIYSNSPILSETTNGPSSTEVVPAEPHKIEMIERRRKEPRLDEGDQPFMYEKSLTKPKPKLRKSLVVKFSISKEKLTRFLKRAPTTQTAWAESSAPVVGSDLEALNISYREPGHNSSSGKPGGGLIEDADMELDIEIDDDFTPSRYRDRRKPGLDGAARPLPDSEITRRATRTQTMTYTEPDEDEFFEAVTTNKTPSKLETMQEASHESKRAKRSDNEELNLNQSTLPITIGKSGSIGRGEQDILIGQVDSAASHQKTNEAPSKNGSATTQHVWVKSDSTPTGAATGSKQEPADSHSKIIAEAQANRRAKMAAIEKNDNNQKTDSDVYLMEQYDSSGLNQLVPSTKDTHSVIQPSRRQSQVAKLPLVAPASHSSGTIGKSTAALGSKSRTITRPKASEADWGESSDDDVPDVPTKGSATHMRSPVIISAKGPVSNATQYGRSYSLIHGRGRGRGRPRNARG